MSIRAKGRVDSKQSKAAWIIWIETLEIRKKYRNFCFEHAELEIHEIGK